MVVYEFLMSLFTPTVVLLAISAGSVYVGLTAKDAQRQHHPMPAEASGLVLIAFGGLLFYFTRATVNASTVMLVPGSDVLYEWLPTVVCGLIAGYLAYRRLEVGGRTGELIEPKFKDGAFPAALFGLLGGYSIQEICLAALNQPGGLTALAPTLVIAMASGMIAYYGQAAAGGKRLAVREILLTVAAAAVALTQLPAPITEQVEQQGAKKGLPFGLGKKKGALPPAFVTVSDPVNDALPMVLTSVAAAALIWRLFFVRPASATEPFVPRALTGVKFPPGMMAAFGGVAINSIYRAASVQEGGFDTLVPLCGLAAGTSLLAYLGVCLQTC